MSIYVDKAHLYCDSDNCDNETMIEAEELGSIDFSDKSEYSSVTAALSDFALMRHWYIDPLTSKVSCPACDIKHNFEDLDITPKNYQFDPA